MKVGCENGRGAAAMRDVTRERFWVGQDCEGRWVVSDRLGLLGGMFISRSAALHFALHEAAHDPELIHIAQSGEIVELVMVGRS